MPEPTKGPENAPLRARPDVEDIELRARRFHEAVDEVRFTADHLEDKVRQLATDALKLVRHIKDMEAERGSSHAPLTEKAVVIRMPNALHAAIKAKAAAEERSMAQTMRHALRRYVDGC